MLVAIGLAPTSCSDDYDDSEIWKEINNIKSELSRINTDISSLKTIVDALNSGSVVTNVEETPDGYKLTFSNNQSVTLKHGNPGESGASAPVIGIKESDGVYYWTINVNGETEWLMTGQEGDADRQRIPVAGQDGSAPKMDVDSEGYWTVDGNRISDGNGGYVKASGEAGDSMFSDVTVDDVNGVVLLTLNDGTVITIPKGEQLTFEIEGADATAEFAFGQTIQFNLTIAGVSKQSISKPDGWKVTITGNQMSVTAPDAANPYAEKGGSITIIAFGGSSSIMAELNVAIGDPVILYSADGGTAWETTMPATFSILTIKTSFGAVVTETMLDNIHSSQTSYGLDLGQADYESTVFRSYGAGGNSYDDKLTSIVLPRNIEEITDFMNCTGLTAIVMPASLKRTAGESVFSGATALTRVEFPEGMEYLGKMMFYYNPMMGYGESGIPPALEEVVIPSTITSWQIGPITTGSYWFFGCENLKRIICKLEIPPDVSTGSWGDFGGSMGANPVPSDCVIYVPDGSVADYEATAGWNEFTIKGLSELP